MVILIIKKRAQLQVLMEKNASEFCVESIRQ